MARKPTKKPARKPKDLAPRRSASVKGGGEISEAQARIEAERQAATLAFGISAVNAAIAGAVGAGGAGTSSASSATVTKATTSATPKI
jgi:hypothetical protein